MNRKFWRHAKSGPHPLWLSAEYHEGPPFWGSGWQRKRRFLFFRFVSIFGVIALLVLGGMAILAFLLTRLLEGNEQTAMLVWWGGCSLALALPLFAAGLAVRAFRGIATPLARVMEAADAVAAGDLSVRVPQVGPGEFARLAHSFNRMTAELERMDQQRRNLTADVAHELRTPLHIIQGNLEGILDGVYEPTEEHLSTTLEETRLLGRLVEDLRTLSLAEAGQLPLVREPVDVAELLADIETSFSGQIEAAGLKLTVAIDERLIDNATGGLTLLGDVGRLNQVMSNLMVNALRHTPPGGSISLRAEPTPDKVRIIVQDTGEGIDPAALPHIFDRFWRGTRTRPDVVGGGLGLAIARQLIQAHQGQISVESELGRGTTFTVQLPFRGTLSAN